MGLFSRKPKLEDTPEYKAYKEENRRALDGFEVTKAWGVKKYRIASQFVYDKAHRQFIVVEGPVDDESVDFRDKNPDIISFDQVKDVWLEVDEYWTTGKGEFEPKPFNQNLTQDKYKDVYWRYDFYLNIETDHPYAGTIRYKMNYKPTVMKVPQRGIFYRRGLEIGGVYRGEDIELLAARLEAFEAKEEKMDDIKRKVELFLLKNKGKGTLEAIGDDLLKSASNEIYYRKLSNMGSHAERAARIAGLLGK